MNVHFATQSKEFGPTFSTHHSKRTNAFNANKIDIVEEFMESKK
jgi:hypothetical protein